MSETVLACAERDQHIANVWLSNPYSNTGIATRIIGCGIAGVAGSAFTMIGSTGPTAGQLYIVDTFLVVVFGGDGNILRAAEWAVPRQVPVLGVNLGHIGFLAELESSQVGDLIETVAGLVLSAGGGASLTSAQGGGSLVGSCLGLPLGFGSSGGALCSASA